MRSSSHRQSRAIQILVFWLSISTFLMTGMAQDAIRPGAASVPQPSPSERHTQKVAAVKSGDYDVALIGDSITHTVGEFGGKYEPMKAVWKKHFAPLNAINLG